MKILHIGQVPKELGGSSTTGVGNVIKELLYNSIDGYNMILYATNISDKDAKKINSIKVIGYSKNWINTYIYPIFKNPIKSLKELLYYKNSGVNPFRYFFYNQNIIKCIKELSPDIIHNHGIIQFIPTYFATENTPILLTFHGFFYSKINDSSHDKLVEKSMPFVNNVTVLTEEMKEELLAEFPKEYDNIYINPNGVDTSKFYYSLDARRQIRSKMNITDEIITFITVGSIQERKGQLSFVKYLHRSGLINYKYILIGKGPQENEIHSYIQNNNIQDKILIIGYVDNYDLYKYYSAADIYAHTSLSEGQALSEIEASATGLKVLVNQCIANTVSGNIDDLSKYCFLDINEESSYDKFKQFCSVLNYNRVSVKSNDWKRIVRNYCDIYDIILANKIYK